MSDGIKRGAGRPKGSRNKSTVNRTNAFQRVFTEEKVVAMANRAFDKIMYEEIPPREFATLFTAISRYIFLSPDAIEEADTLIEITSKEEAERIKEALRQRLLADINK